MSAVTIREAKYFHKSDLGNDTLIKGVLRKHCYFTVQFFVHFRPYPARKRGHTKIHQIGTRLLIKRVSNSGQAL
jgi:hypothetical protein